MYFEGYLPRYINHVKEQKINVRENKRDNQEWTIHRNWLHLAHKTKDEHEHSKQHNTICGGYRYTQTNRNNVNKT